VAGLFGLLWALQGRQSALPGDVWLAANVGEEGLGDLRGMKAVVERFGAEVTGYIVLEGMAVGHVYHRGLGVQRYRIAAHCQGGHSWVDYGRPSAIHELARLATKLADMKLPSKGRSSLNIGVIAGGTSINTIAAEAHLELDLRSEEDDNLQRMVAQVNELVQAAEQAEVHFTMELIGRRPAGKLAQSHKLVKLARKCLEAQGFEPVLTIGSTDANVPLSLGYPAVCIGLSSGAGAHTIHEFIHTAPLAKGLAQLTALVEGAF
jgi:acetylornithine deacetylase/succinyl-diaminopimelate desuccinylase-like protein